MRRPILGMAQLAGKTIATCTTLRDDLVFVFTDESYALLQMEGGAGLPELSKLDLHVYFGESNIDHLVSIGILTEQEKSQWRANRTDYLANQEAQRLASERRLYESLKAKFGVSK